ELRTLGQRRADEQSGIRTSKDSEIVCRGSSRLDKPFRCREEIVVGGLAVAPLGGFVPLRSELRPSPDVGQGEQAPSFNQEGDEDAELRGHRYAISSIRSKDRRMAAACKDIATAH